MILPKERKEREIEKAGLEREGTFEAYLVCDFTRYDICDWMSRSSDKFADREWFDQQNSLRFTPRKTWMAMRAKLYQQGSYKSRFTVRPGISDAAEKFSCLAQRWHRETAMLSLIRQKAMHPAYQKIIGMGREALPFIFQEMRNRRGDWFWALEAITEDEEQPPARHSNFKEATQVWLKWGEDNGYL